MQYLWSLINRKLRFDCNMKHITSLKLLTVLTIETLPLETA